MTVTEADHVCSPPENPRYKHTCVRCGRAIPQVFRDRRFEAEILRQVCGGLKADLEAVVTLAGRRADDAERDYRRDFPDTSRDLAWEGCEELLDCVNYVRWKLDGLNRSLWPDDIWMVEPLQNTLRLTVLAFEELRQCATEERRAAGG